MRRWRNIVMVVACIALLALVLASCGETTPTPGDPGGSGGTPSPSPAPGDGLNRVVVASSRSAVSWDPPADWASEPEWIISNAYDYLFTRSADGSEWEPELATDWERLDDYTVRFSLRDDVVFHDGTPFTAEDVKYHYERIIAGTREEYIVRDQYQWIAQINIIDEYTVDIVSEEPDSLFFWKLAQTNTGAGIVSKAYVEDVGPEGVHRQPMGTGAWELSDWGRDEFVLFSRNQNYWRENANFDELEFRVIPEKSTQVAELLTGGVHLVYGIMPTDEDRVSRSEDVDTLWAKSGTGFSVTVRTGIHPDHVDEPELNRYFATEDPRVREAIELAIDKYAIRDIVGGDGEPYRARNFMPLDEATPELYGESANLYDPDRAAELIAEAGYAPGECTLVFHARDVYPHGDLARIITAMLEEVGFDVDLRLMDVSTFNSEIYYPRKTQELMLMDLSGNMNPFFMSLGFHSGRNHEYGPIDDAYHARVDALLNIAWTEVHDYDAYVDAFRQVSMESAEARHRAIGLFQVSNLWGINKAIDYTPRFDNYINGIDIRVR